MKTGENGKKLIGRVERIDLPEWKMYGLDAKIDTGAYTSSFHCVSMHLDRRQNSVTFEVPEEDGGGDGKKKRSITAPIVGIRRVRSSNGMVEERLTVRTTLSVGGESHIADLTLTNRADMKFPILLGRRFLKDRFVVDVSAQYLYDS